MKINNAVVNHNTVRSINETLWEEHSGANDGLDLIKVPQYRNPKYVHHVIKKKF